MKYFKDITKADQPLVGNFVADAKASNVDMIGGATQPFINNNVLVRSYYGEEEDRFNLCLMPILNYEKWQKNDALIVKKTLLAVRENWDHHFLTPFKKWCKDTFLNGEWVFSENTLEYTQQNYIAYLLLKNIEGGKGTYQFICFNILKWLFSINK